MPRVSSKRQITIPVDQCQEVGIDPGDDVETFVYNGQITIVKKTKGSASGILKHIRTDKRFTDQQSLESAIEHKGASKNA